MGELADNAYPAGLAELAEVVPFAGLVLLVASLADDASLVWVGLAMIVGGAVLWCLRPLARGTLCWDEHGLERRARFGGWRIAWHELDSLTMGPGPAFGLKRRGSGTQVRLAHGDLGDQARPLFEVLRRHLPPAPTDLLVLQPAAEVRTLRIGFVLVCLVFAAMFAVGAVVCATHQVPNLNPRGETPMAIGYAALAGVMLAGALRARSMGAIVELDHDGLTQRLGRRETRLSWSAVTRVTLRRDGSASERLVVEGEGARIVLTYVDNQWLPAVAWVCRHAVGAQFRDASITPAGALWREWLAEATGHSALPPAPRRSPWPVWTMLSALSITAVALVPASVALGVRQRLALPTDRQRRVEARITANHALLPSRRYGYYEFQIGEATFTGRVDGGARLPAGGRLTVVYCDTRPDINRPLEPPPTPAQLAAVDRQLWVEGLVAALAGLVSVLMLVWLRCSPRPWRLPTRRLG